MIAKSLITGLVTLTLAYSAGATTLEDVKERGYVLCGISTGLLGYSTTDDNGEWTGLDVDFCRAVAAAVFADPKAVRFVPTTNKERFTALQSGEVDLLSRNTTWTFSRDVNLGLEYVGVNYYDGQAFLVPKALEVGSVLELDGASICIQTGSTTELNLADYFRANGMSYQSVVIATPDEGMANYAAEVCDAYTTDSSGLASIRSSLPDPSAHIILPEVISKEPLGLIVRHGDNQWADIVRWSLFATILAEELDVSSTSVEEMRSTSQNPETRRLLGVDASFGEQFGLSNEWAYNIILMVGNYEEIFERNVGTDTPLQLERGLNALWTDGGILYAPPIR